MFGASEGFEHRAPTVRAFMILVILPVRVRHSFSAAEFRAELLILAPKTFSSAHSGPSRQTEHCVQIAHRANDEQYFVMHLRSRARCRLLRQRPTQQYRRCGVTACLLLRRSSRSVCGWKNLVAPPHATPREEAWTAAARPRLERWYVVVQENYWIMLENFRCGFLVDPAAPELAAYTFTPTEWSRT